MSDPTTCATPLEVLDAAIETLSAPDGYIIETYHAVPRDVTNRDTEESWKSVKVERATAHCAIGGVEHAIWKLCGEDVSKSRDQYAYAGSSRFGGSAPRRPRKPTMIVYQSVMKALNEETRARSMGGDVEAATFDYPKDEVLDIFESAKARLT